MKRLISLSLAILIMISLPACESPQERANREIRESIDAYHEAQNRIDSIQHQIDVFEGLLGE